MSTLLLDVPGRTARLTTEHAASNYSVPVLDLDGIAYGPADLVDAGGPEPITAAELVRQVGLVPDPAQPMSEEAAEMMRSLFLGARP